MIQKDYIQRMIDALSKVMGHLIGLKPPEGLEIIKEAYRDYLKIEGEWLDGLVADDFLNTLIQERKLNIYQIEFLAELLAREGELYWGMNNEIIAQKKFEKAIILIEWVEANSEEYSLERRMTLEKLKKTRLT